jgi:ketosteroid isomerase-like protein
VTTELAPTGAVAVVLTFNEAINARDLSGLSGLMTDTHRFVDSAGTTIDGKRACVDAWRGFFDAFPDYRNVFDEAVELEPGIVLVRGRSECTVAELDGPAEWRAVVHDDRVDEWHVSEPSSTES